MKKLSIIGAAETLQAPDPYAMKLALSFMGINGFKIQYHLSNMREKWQFNLTEVAIAETTSSPRLVGLSEYEDVSLNGRSSFYSSPYSPLEPSESTSQSKRQPIVKPTLSKDRNWLSFSDNAALYESMVVSCENKTFHLFRNGAAFYAYEPQARCLYQSDNAEEIKQWLESQSYSSSSSLSKKTRLSLIGDRNINDTIIQPSFKTPYASWPQGVKYFVGVVVSPVMSLGLVLMAALAAIAALIKGIMALLALFKSPNKHAIDMGYWSAASVLLLVAAPVLPLFALASFITKTVLSIKASRANAVHKNGLPSTVDNEPAVSTVSVNAEVPPSNPKKANGQWIRQAFPGFRFGAKSSSKQAEPEPAAQTTLASPYVVDVGGPS